MQRAVVPDLPLIAPFFFLAWRPGVNRQLPTRAETPSLDTYVRARVPTTVYAYN
jgi:hypothetical protein